MELKQIVNPDDLDQIFRGIQMMIDQKENDLNIKVLDKYKMVNLQDQDKKLLQRFFFRISELQEKTKNPQILTIIQNVKEIVSANKKPEVTQNILFKRITPPWQQHISENKGLFRYYEHDIWRIYDIMLLNRQFFSSIIIFHHSKEENQERLFEQIWQRNQHLIQDQWSQDEESLIERSENLKKQQLNSVRLQTPYSNKNITMFGSPTRLKSSSPLRAMRDNFLELEFRIPQRKRNFSLHTNEKISIETKTNNKSSMSPQKLPEIKTIQQSDFNSTFQQDALIKPIPIGTKYYSPQKKRGRTNPLQLSLIRKC